ncbi:MAG: hypothetical protein KJO36_06060 [Acidimicrobiia bacterium]|nr:hypothetical protein [Acidimicrobiia bacterium]
MFLTMAMGVALSDFCHGRECDTVDHRFDIRYVIDGTGYTELPERLEIDETIMVGIEVTGGCWTCEMDTGVVWGISTGGGLIELHNDYGFSGCTAQSMPEPETVWWEVQLTEETLDVKAGRWRFIVGYQGSTVCTSPPRLPPTLFAVHYVGVLEAVYAR